MIAVPFSNHFFIFIYLFSYLFIYVIFNFYKNYVIIIIFFNPFFFHENYFYFLCSGMFRNVPACSGMFRVPGFIDAPHDRCRVPSVVDAWR